jgi:hypothetical protein
MQYTGSNAADVMAYIDTVFAPEICTIAGNTITCFVGEMNPNDWFIHQFGSANYILGGNLVTLDSTPSIVSSNVFNPQMLLDAPHAETISLGVGSVPTLLGSAQATINVTLKPAFADTNYVATAIVTGAVNLLASLSVVSTSIVNATTVSVVVRNTGLLSLSGASILVAAVHN